MTFNPTISSRRLPLLGALLALLGIIAGLFPTSIAQDDLEDRVKAGWIYQCAQKFVWPASRTSDGKFTIGVIGNDDIRSILASAIAKNGNKIGDRPATVISASATDVPRCHLVYVARSSRSIATAAITQARGNAVLTMGETDDGFMVKFIPVNESLGIAGDRALIKQEGIKFTADILRVLK